MILRTTLFGNVYNFKDVKEVLAKANEEKSGDRLAGIIANSTAERVAAKVVLSELTIGDLRNNPVVDYDKDEVTRVIQDGVDEEVYNRIKGMTIGDFREFLLSSSGDEIKGIRDGLTSEVIAGSEISNTGFGIDVKLMDEAYTMMEQLKSSKGNNFMYFETGQGSELSSDGHNGADQLTMEASSKKQESQRTVISNIHKNGMPPVEAGAQIVQLIETLLKEKKSGIELKL